jgi:membrane protease YdiL (CAAX protease family)
MMDFPVALLLAVVSILAALVIVRLLGPEGWPSLEGMRPSTPLEIALWILMALSAGICEEAVFRGYLQQQFTRWIGRGSAGVLAQAAVFGLTHGYQGWKNMVLIFGIGCIFGASAALRRGLRANMIAHAGVDILNAF